MCGEVEKGLSVERGCTYGKGHHLQVRCARLESAKRGRKTEVQWCPEMAPRTERFGGATVLVVSRGAGRRVAVSGGVARSSGWGSWSVRAR